MENPNSNTVLQLITTEDGSQTILNNALGSTYHSRHGALTESKHVFIEKGLQNLLDGRTTDINLLEMGFGSGLNALLTATIAEQTKYRINYQALELFPVPPEVWSNYLLPEELVSCVASFQSMHAAKWNAPFKLNNWFELVKHQVSLIDFLSDTQFDLVYFDAFEPEKQPELWTQAVFEKLLEMMNPGAILTTYCCKGYVRRNMIAAGFVVQKVPGPPGKREMIIAHRPL